MLPILQFIFRDFPTFFGTLILGYLILYFPFNFALQVIHKKIRAKTIREKGYPPQYCDGDGDFKKDNDE